MRSASHVRPMCFGKIAFHGTRDSAHGNNALHFLRPMCPMCPKRINTTCAHTHTRAYAHTHMELDSHGTHGTHETHPHKHWVSRVSHMGRSTGHIGHHVKGTWNRVRVAGSLSPYC